MTKENWTNKWFKMGVLNICERIHMHCTGTSDPMMEDVFDEAYAYLQTRLLNWKSQEMTKRYDSNVKYLIIETIEEAKKYKENFLEKKKENIEKGLVQARVIQNEEDKHQKGLYSKFDIKRLDRKDGRGEKHENCFYFVLDLDHDKFAVQALRAYARACETEFPTLSSELLYKTSIAEKKHPKTAFHKPTDIVSTEELVNKWIEEAGDWVSLERGQVMSDDQPWEPEPETLLLCAKELKASLKKEKKLNEEYKEILKFYAHPKLYENTSLHWPYLSGIDLDKGGFARQVLNITHEEAEKEKYNVLFDR